MATPVGPPDDISGVTTIWEWLKGGLGAAIGVAAGFIWWTFKGGLRVGKTAENVDNRLDAVEKANRANAEAVALLQEAQQKQDIVIAKIPDRDELERVRDSIQRQMQDVQKQIHDATVMILQTVRGHATKT